MWLYYLMIALFALQNHWLWNMQLVGTVTVFKVLGVIVLIYALCYAVRHSYLAFLWNRTTTLFMWLFLMATVSYLFLGTSSSVAPFQSYVSMLSLVISTLLLVDSFSKLQNTLRASLVGVAFGGLYVIREFQLYHGIFPDMRPGWVVGDPNYYATGAVVCLPFGLALLDLEIRNLHRFVILGCSVVTVIALVLTGSRGGLLAMGAFMVFAFCSGRRHKRIIPLALLLSLLMMVVPLSPIARLLFPDRSDTESVDFRKELLVAGIEMVKQHPLIGVGLGNFKFESKGFLKRDFALVAHNTYLEVAAELGLPALAVFFALLRESWRTLRKIQRRSEPSLQPHLKSVCFSLEGSLVAFLVAALFISGEYQRYLWLVVALSMVMERFPASSESGWAKRGRRALFESVNVLSRETGVQQS